MSEVIITGEAPDLKAQLIEFWRYRGLLTLLVWRNLKVRYAQTIFGAGWALLQPLITSLVLALVMGKFAHLPSDGTPHLPFYMAAMVPWTFFASAVSAASNSLVSNQSLLTKVYFPRLALPVAAVLGGLVDMFFGMICLAVVLLISGVFPSPLALLWLPLLLVPAVVAAIGLGVGLAALNLKYRDVGYVVPFLVQLGLYASPVLYSASIIPARLQAVYFLNPMAAVLDGFRAVLFGTHTVSLSYFAISTASALVMFALGCIYFERTERRFADHA